MKFILPAQIAAKLMLMAFAWLALACFAAPQFAFAQITADAGDDQTVLQGDFVTLDGGGSTDSMNRALSYSWVYLQAESGTGAPALSAVAVENITHTFTTPSDYVGALVFRLIVFATGTITTFEDRVTITTVAAGDVSIDAPSDLSGHRDSGDITLNWQLPANFDSANDVYHFTRIEISADGNTWTIFADTGTLLDNSTAISYTLRGLATTRHFRISANVFDFSESASGYTAVSSVIVIRPITAEAGPDQTVLQGDFITLDGGGSTDSLNRALTYSWAYLRTESGTGAPALSTAAIDGARYTFTAPNDYVGTLVFRLIVFATGTIETFVDRVTITTAPAGDVSIGPPTDLTGHRGNGDIALSWQFPANFDPANDVYNFTRIEISDDRGATWMILADTGSLLDKSTATAYTHLGLPQVANRHYRVSANLFDFSQDATGYTAVTSAIAVSTLGNAPLANTMPTDLTAVAGNRGEIHLAWELPASTDYRNTYIDASESRGGPWRRIHATNPNPDDNADTATTWTHRGLPNGTTRYYRVRGFGEFAGVGGMATTRASNVAFAATLPLPTALIVGGGNVAESAVVTLDGSGSSDVDDALSFQWRQIAPQIGDGAELTLSGDATDRLIFTAPNRLIGDVELVFELQVSGGGDTDTATATVTVNGENDPPLVDAGENVRVNAGDVVTLVATASDPEGRELNYQWTQTRGRTMALYGEDTAAASFRLPAVLEENAENLVFELTVSDGVMTAVDTVTVRLRGTINEVNDLLMPEIAKTLLAGLDVVGNRIAHASDARYAEAIDAAQFNLDGRAVAHGEVSANLLAAAARHRNDGRGIDAMLANSNFVMPLHNGAVESANWAIWGGGERRNIEGKRRGVDWDGKLDGMHFGIDGTIGNHFLIGVAESQLASEIEYEDTNADAEILGEGEYKLDMTTTLGYLGWRVRAFDAWVSGGSGEGELAVLTSDEEAETDIELRIAAIGVNGIARSTSAERETRVKGEFSQTDWEIENTEAIAAAEMTAYRARFAIEFSALTHNQRGGESRGQIEVGMRYDGGYHIDRENSRGGGGRDNTGFELAFGGDYRTATGVRIDARIRGMTGNGYGEWGMQGGVRKSAGLDGQGLSFNLSPGYGDAQSGLNRLWENGLPDVQVADRADDYAMRLNARLDYGMLLRDGGRFTPYSAMTVGDGDLYSLGLKWQGAHLGLDLIGEQRRTDTAENRPENSVLLKGGVSF